MKLGSMQPYFLPLNWLFLIQAVDEFVLYDDVSYIKVGWINPNFILANSNRQLITMLMQGARP